MSKVKSNNPEFRGAAGAGRLRWWPISKWTFRRQLSFFFLVTAVSAVFLVTIIAYAQAINELKQNFIIYTASVFKRTRDDLVTKFNAIENTLNFISNDLRLQNLNEYGTKVSYRDLSKFFVDCINLNNYQESAGERRFTKNLIDELIFFGEQSLAMPVIISRREHFTVYDIDKYLSSELLAKARSAQGKVIWSEIFYNELGARLMGGKPEESRREELNQLAVVKYVTDEKFKTGIGFLIASINLARLSALVEEIVLGEAGRIFITDGNLRVLGAREKSLIYQTLPLDERSASILQSGREGSIEGRFKGEDSFVHFEEIGLNDWKLVGIIASHEFQRSAGVVRNRILFGGIIILLMAVTAALVIAGNITRPIQKICTFLQQVEEGDLTLRTYETGSVEIENLSTRLNRMIERLSRLLTEIYQEQIFKRKVALKALHAQINPHFLYNTLDSISWMVETGRREVAADLLVSLATFFRIGLSGGREIVTIAEEMEHAESYLRVQKIRYRNKLDYLFNIDDEIKKSPIVKITLQPLIENAIYHGIKPKTDGPGIICISGSRTGENTIKLSVVDNGIGMSAGKIEELNTVLAETRLDLETEGKGYSIRNINSRIKLAFGQEYGLKYSGQAGTGTRVDVILPAHGKVREDTA